MSNLYEQKKKLLRTIKNLKKKEILQQYKEEAHMEKIDIKEPIIVKKSHYLTIKSILFQSE